MANTNRLSEYKINFDKDTLQGKMNLENSLREQSLFRDLRDNKKLFEVLIKCIEVEPVADGKDIHLENDIGKNCLYLVLKGGCRGLKKNNTVVILPPGEFFGEFPILDHSINYEIQAQADGDSCFGKISEWKLKDLGKEFPEIWINMASVLAKRLREQNEKSYNKPLNKVPRLFIGSSKKALEIATQLKRLLNSKNLEARIWSEVFDVPGESYLERLQTISEEFDYGVFVFNDDDDTVSKRVKYKSTRDNVIFELGIFVGKYNRRRAFILWPDSKNVKIPSDFMGIITTKYESMKKEDDKSDKTLEERLKPACDIIKKNIEKMNIAQQRIL